MAKLGVSAPRYINAGGVNVDSGTPIKLVDARPGRIKLLLAFWGSQIILQLGDDTMTSTAGTGYIPTSANPLELETEAELWVVRQDGETGNVFVSFMEFYD